MGTVYGNMYRAYVSSPDCAPDVDSGPTFDPLYGFENGRKERVAKATAAEMEGAGLNPAHRDYCSHLLIDYLKCRDEKFPYISGCKPELHSWHGCQNEDYILRMKEYERERRLKERAKRIGSKNKSDVVDE